MSPISEWSLSAPGAEPQPPPREYSVPIDTPSTSVRLGVAGGRAGAATPALRPPPTPRHSRTRCRRPTGWRRSRSAPRSASGLAKGPLSQAPTPCGPTAWLWRGPGGPEGPRLSRQPDPWASQSSLPPGTVLPEFVGRVARGGAPKPHPPVLPQAAPRLDPPPPIVVEACGQAVTWHEVSHRRHPSRHPTPPPSLPNYTPS